MKSTKSQELVFGLRPVIEAIHSGKYFVKILFKRGLKGELFQECFSEVRKNNIPFQYVPQEKLNTITRANHQGCIGIISPVAYQKIENILPGIYETGKDPFLIILDGITDIRNFGAITRTAEAAGVDAIVIGSKKAAMINAEAIKTSSGAITRIPVCREENLEQTVKYLHESGLRLIGASEKAQKLYSEADYNGPLAIVMGAEDTGISEQVIKQLDILIKIPMLGTIASLNVSVASGIILFEAIRQKI